MYIHLVLLNDNTFFFNDETIIITNYTNVLYICNNNYEFMS